MTTVAASESPPTIEQAKQPPAPTDDACSYKIVQTLGEGAFGEVLLVVDKKNAAYVAAMKRISMAKCSESNRKLVRKEALIQRMLSKTGHQNVIRYIGLRTDDVRQEFYIFLEYADAGELFDQINPDTGMPVARAQRFFRQIISGLEYIHSHGVVHRDIKPENLLLTSSGVLKISDFGMATVFRHEGRERLLDMSCGTLPYAAPEVIAGGKYKGEPVDLWSAGVVLVAMLTGELPWDKANDSSNMYLNWTANTLPDNCLWDKICVSGLALLRVLLIADVGKRANIERIKHHPFVTQNCGAVGGSGPVKRFKLDEDDWVVCTQFEAALNRTDEDGGEMANRSFSQPTRPEELLCTLQIDFSQGSKDPLRRLVRRMTRFCVTVNGEDALARVIAECTIAGYAIKNTANQALVTYRDLSFMVSVYEMVEERSLKVMLDFRRSRGDGIQFKRIFLQIRQNVDDIISKEDNGWLIAHGLTPALQSTE